MPWRGQTSTPSPTEQFPAGDWVARFRTRVRPFIPNSDSSRASAAELARKRCQSGRKLESGRQHTKGRCIGCPSTTLLVGPEKDVPRKPDWIRQLLAGPNDKAPAEEWDLTFSVNAGCCQDTRLVWVCTPG
ncbi:hypothetical protein RE0356_10300 [Prescottella equi]|nr:hypothetical protein RE0356_10300 [Prescottella equi]